jgi:type II secretory pathway pseudopilin PulG
MWYRKFFRVNVGSHVITTQRPITLQGFTLIELLLVIAGLIILAALLVPVLGKARVKSTAVTDLNNLKQQTMAVYLYSTDNEDFTPWPNWLAGDVAATGAPRPGWLYTLNPLALNHQDKFKIETGLLWNILHDRRIYRCPRDDMNCRLFK